jgi:hypothetical protein
MKWLRLSIASLMAFIAYAAVGLTAFANVNDPYYGRLWDDAYYTVTVLLLAIATIMAVLSPGRSRARWLGFAVFGWVHLNFGWPDAAGSPQGNGTFRPRFVHPTLINWVIFPVYPAAAPHLQEVRDFVQPWFPPAAHQFWMNFVWHDVQTTLTMATALLGAVVGHFLANRVERGQAAAHEPDDAGRPGP